VAVQGEYKTTYWGAGIPQFRYELLPLGVTVCILPSPIAQRIIGAVFYTDTINSVRAMLLLQVDQWSLSVMLL
jgi:hypothetical protein